MSVMNPKRIGELLHTALIKEFYVNELNSLNNYERSMRICDNPERYSIEEIEEAINYLTIEHKLEELTE